MVKINRRTFVSGGIAMFATSFSGTPSWSQNKPTVRVGVITPLTGPVSIGNGIISIAQAELAAEDFVKQYNPDFNVEVVSADLQDKADVALSIARDWFDSGYVDVISNVANSAAALAMGDLLQTKDKVALFAAASSELTGKGCGPNQAQIVLNTWTYTAVITRALMSRGKKSWFMIGPDYAFGKQMTADATAIIEASGGTVKGRVAYPYGQTADFASYLLQAQSSGAEVIALSTAGTDTSNCLKQAKEFGIGSKGDQVMAGFLVGVDSIHAAGLDNAQGLIYSGDYYWDMNDKSRELGKRVFAKTKSMPSQMGDYAGVLHYLKAVADLGVEKGKASGRATMERMKELPMDDDAYGSGGAIRADGTRVGPLYLTQVKKPEESKYAWDYVNVLGPVSKEEGFRPLDKSGCPYI